MTRHLTTAAAIAALSVPGLAFAQAGGDGSGGPEATTFDFFADTQLSNQIAYTDFNTIMRRSPAFETFDADRDELLTRDEFERGVYDLYVDRPTTTEPVAGMGTDPLFREQPWESEVQRSEIPFADFQAGVGDRPVWVGWDQDGDGMIDRDEWTRGLFTTYDVDRDEVLTEPELEAMRASPMFRY